MLSLVQFEKIFEPVVLVNFRINHLKHLPIEDEIKLFISVLCGATIKHYKELSGFWAL